jgi:phage shock protein E
MILNNITNKFILLFMGVFFIWRFFERRIKQKHLKQLIQKGATIIDVRSQNEFESGSRLGSLNIPLSEINEASKKLDKQKTFVFCCASGIRSRRALKIFKRNGFKNLVNAGSWKAF